MIRMATGLAICLNVSAVSADMPLFKEQAGRVVIEVESHPPAGAWTPEKALEGYTGAGYYTWRGPNLFRSPGNGLLTYILEIVTPGTYQLRIRNRHDFHDSTLQNDCFTRIDGGPWIKTFSSKRGEWTFRTNHELDHNAKPKASYELKPGRHVLQISGRSQGFSIDRIHLFREGDRGGEDASLPETRLRSAAPDDNRQAEPAPNTRAGTATTGQTPNLGARLALAKRFLSRDDVPRAKRILTALVDNYPDSPEGQEATRLLEQLD